MRRCLEFIYLTLLIYVTHGRRLDEDKETWSYRETQDGIAGPSKWATVATTCGGQRQSPINFNVLDSNYRAPVLDFEGKCESVQVSKSHGTIYKWMISNGTCTAKVSDGDIVYKMDDFHIHAPSEHTFHGGRYDAEVHFVHKTKQQDKALVVGILLDCSSEFDNYWLEGALQPLASAACGDDSTKNISVGPIYDIIASRTSTFYNYQGSLTVPPCTEFVDWWVMKDPVKCSRRQLQTLLSAFKRLPGTDNGKNARPVQPLNGRIIRKFG